MLHKQQCFIANLMTLINWIWYIKPNAYFLLRSGRHGSGGDHPSTDKRAHHNALERKRRDHIKDSFSSLRDAIPTMQVSFDSDLLKFPNDQCVFNISIDIFLDHSAYIVFFQGDKSSRAQILKKASDYITFMRRKNQSHQQVSLFTNPLIICVLL